MSVDVDHADAALGLLRASTALTVYGGALPADATTVAPPYVLVYSAVEWPSDDGQLGLDGGSGTCVATWWCHCVGETDLAAVAVTGQVRRVLLDARPTITGRVCDRIVQVGADPPRRDEVLGRVLMDAVVVYELRTRPG